MKKLRNQAKSLLNKQDLLQILSIKYNTNLEEMSEDSDKTPYHILFNVVWSMSIREYYPVYKRTTNTKLKLFFDLLKQKENKCYQNAKWRTS